MNENNLVTIALVMVVIAIFAAVVLYRLGGGGLPVGVLR